MHRLIVPALLSFTLTLAGCGGGDTAGDPAATPTTGSSSGTATPQATPSIAATYDTPQAVYDAFAKASKEKNWKTATALLSRESQSMMAAGMIMGASFMTMGDEAKQKDLEQLLQKHGIDLNEEPPADDQDAGPEALTRPIKDLPTFVGEVAAWMDKQGDGEGSGMPEMGKLGEVTVDGDNATASIETEMGPQPIEFHRVDGSWLIHLPMEGPPPDADMPLEPSALDPGELNPDAATPPNLESENNETPQ
jgi:hypothetical protein